ncbi:hypothetical protein JQV27_01775 [Sulfitobacter mediterraneus]|jgi:hypothetical protein|uniref:hypothetical protein n=1 Tax=Sulfitobacter TaxID=60136 RepID=UPI0019340158|nr:MULTISPECIES: hypothetical protein [Sulfitobacter]MBM1631549.1 hypothetical protein [Sulfitobacter mediterraneus]MBM1639364.1 hypothetical protein [Sulfitobacter mediterraneus]MBM1643413.1 hypothetical protein [Sulfitobacter mediterraneus]MBM1647459.1 hypothetical protein [Sulfitobacter mediterraneus]MBM1651504.1 hypothetical protein [Sulfitobacter mediterraneus]
MKIILTGPQGNLAYYARQTPRRTKRAFGFQGRFKHQQALGFARLPAFGANGNHAPTGYEGAVTSNLALELLFNIAGKR